MSVFTDVQQALWETFLAIEEASLVETEEYLRCEFHLDFEVI